MTGLMDERGWEARRSGTLSRRPSDYRTPFERDRARVIHSAAFRRLQAKTQVLGITEGDFHRTRLTHTMEVAQIARGLVLHLRAGSDGSGGLPDLELVETIAFAHDLGHPPFGHGGEVALNYALRNHGGFEGNGQTLRILSRLEPHRPGYGLDLTRRALLGILKYPRPYSEVSRTRQPDAPERLSQVVARNWKPPKCFLDTERDIVEWLLEPMSPQEREHVQRLSLPPGENDHGKTAWKSFDCSIMEVADDIAYGVHDFEDGVALGLIGVEQINRFADELDSTWAHEFGLGHRSTFVHQLTQSSAEGGNRKRAIGTLVHAMIASAFVEPISDAADPVLGRRLVLLPEARRVLEILKDLAYAEMIAIAGVQTLEYRGMQIVMGVFEALASDPKRLLTPNSKAAYEIADSEISRLRVVGDFVAGMTDTYVTRLYERLFIPGQGSVFERL